MSTAPPRLSHAETARTILQRCRHGALSTLATSPEGHPYGSLVSYAVSEQGDPILLMSDLAEHVQNIKRDPRASLLATDSLRHDDPLADGRVSVLGEVVIATEREREALRGAILKAHPEAQLYIDFKDFNLYTLRVSQARFIGGFGRMSWLPLEAWGEAQPDPLWSSAKGIIEHMNEDHADALLLYARHYGGAEDTERAVMVGVDQYGMDIMAHTAARPRRLRVGFSKAAKGSGAVRRELVRMSKEARGESGEGG